MFCERLFFMLCSSSTVQDFPAQFAQKQGVNFESTATAWQRHSIFSLTCMMLGFLVVIINLFILHLIIFHTMLLNNARILNFFYKKMQVAVSGGGDLISAPSSPKNSHTPKTKKPTVFHHRLLILNSISLWYR
jgi:hypothetical protein